MAKRLKSIKDNWLLLIISFLLLFIPLYPKFPLMAVSGTYVHIRLEDVFVALAVGFWGISLILKRDFSFLKNSVVKLILLFLGIGLISVLNAVFITKNIQPHIALLHLLRRLEYISLLFVSYYSIKNLNQIKVLGWTIFVAVWGVIIYGIGQKFFGWPVISTMNKEFSKGMILQLTWWARINSTFAGHYDLAAFMAMILPLIATAIILVKKTFQKLIIFLLGIFSYYILLLTASRVSFGAFLIAVSFVLWFAKKKFWIIPFLALSILGMIFSDDLGQRYAATFKIDLSFLSNKINVNKYLSQAQKTAAIPTPTQIPTQKPVAPIAQKGTAKLPTSTPTPTPAEEKTATSSGKSYPDPETVYQATSRSTDIRLNVEWPRALRAFAKNPILGTGYSSITLATDNDYLRMLGEIGLLGTASFFAIFLEIGRRFFVFLSKNSVKEKEKMIIFGIIGAAIAFFLNATFIDIFEASKVAFFFWILMGTALKVVDLKIKQKENYNEFYKNEK